MERTHILFWREELFEVCKLGFMAETIGNVWCSGYIPTERLDQLTVPYRIL